MTAYDERPVRYAARKQSRCDGCGQMIPKGHRLCVMGQFKSCKNCEDTLPPKYKEYRERMACNRMLSPDQVRKIREMADRGDTHQSIADALSVNIGTVGEVARRRTYRDVT